MKKELERKKLEFHGFALDEYLRICAEVRSCSEFAQWSEFTDFEFMEISEGEEPFIRLRSHDRRWRRLMRWIFSGSKVLEEMKNGYGLEVEVTELVPGSPVHSIALALWKSVQWNLASPFQVKLT